ncbi:metallophosphoesterase family protein [Gaoshiqia sp. Z1-71]|uniref:metallophosphoesterase family protein n=1 Tax=Gaoshiqia hydrogeniformans TaxID=3290090 RepID=UPI003BF78546
MTHSFHLKLIGLVVGLLIAAGVFAQPDTLSFLHVSDIHLIFNMEKFQPDFAETRKHYANGVEPFKDFLKKIPAQTGAEFVIVTGDLVDFSEGETTGGEMSGWLIDQFSELVKKQKEQLFFTLGNHDIAAYSWNGTSRVSSRENAGKSRAHWIRSLTCFSEGTYYSRTVTVGKTAYQLIFLDNSYNTVRENESVSVPFISVEQQHWLEARFADSDDDVEIILMHIPMNPAPGESMSSCKRYPVLTKNPSAKLILAGHNHKNILQDFPSGENKKMLQVQTGAFAQDTKNWRLIRLTEDSILVSVPGDVKTEVAVSVK